MDRAYLAQPLFERVQLRRDLGGEVVEFRQVLAELRQLRLPLLGVHMQQLRHRRFGHVDAAGVDPLGADRRHPADRRSRRLAVPGTARES